MKHLITLAFIFIHFISFAQKNGKSDYNSNQSSVYGNAGSYLAIDGIQLQQSSAMTLETANPFWKVSLNEINKITEVNIIVPDTSFQTTPDEYYIIFSLDSIRDTPLTPPNLNGDHISPDQSDNENIRLATILTDSRKYSICVSRHRLSRPLYFDSLFARHISIVSPVRTQLEIIEVQIKGTEVPKYDVNRGVTGFLMEEKCNDNIDNNLNNFIDCEEYNCRVQYSNINYTKPSCPVCNDGKICISAMNVQQISFDGGISWENFNDLSRQCYEQLPSGDYNIVLKSPGGCSKTENVNMLLPPGTSSSLCENGDFELGNFTGFTFETGINQQNPYGPHNLTPGFNVNVHNIINVQNFSDPYVGNLINNPGFLGRFAFRLGDDRVVGSQGNPVSQMESLKFKFTVTNADFSFNYARVTEDPSRNHLESELPFFYWEVTDLQGNILYSETELSNNQFYLDFGRYRYSGWNCAHTDLSSYLGQELYVRFINSDCGRWEHWAYTYIDNICAPSATVTPVITNVQTCENITQVCSDQSLDLTFPPGGYNRYQCVISKINASGADYDLWQSPVIIGVEAKFDDVIGYYEVESGFTTACSDKIKVVLRVFNGCSEAVSDPYIYTISCNDYTVDYCNPMTYCREQNDVQIKGSYECPGCSIAWNPSNSLDDGSIPFPKASVNQLYPTLNNRIYRYDVTTTEGCKYCGEVRFIKNGYQIVPHPIDRGYCSYTYGIDIILSPELGSILNNDIIIRKTNIVNGTSEVVHPIGSGNTRSISFSQLRESDTQYRLEVMIVPELCSDGYTCKQSYTFDRIYRTSYHSYWKAAIPNTFSPNGDGENDVWHLTFRSLDESLPLSCSNMSEDNSSIYSYSIKIYDRWGENLVFSQSISKPFTDTQGFTGEEITWDGTFNGQPVAEGMYVGVITTSSCYDNDFRCNDCDSQDPFQYCFGKETSCAKPFENNNNNFATKCGITVVR
jgi:hypothetical protein